MSAWSRIRNVFRVELNNDIDRELQSHFDEARDDGRDPADVTRAFGSRLRAREATRDAIVAVWLESWLQDVRRAVRQLRRSPVFTATAVLTLAIGIGATTAIFSLVQQVMLRSLPVARPDRLWRVGDVVSCCYQTGYAQDDWTFFPWEAYTAFRAHTPAFEELAGFQVGATELGVRRYGANAAVTTFNGDFVTGNFFSTLGVSAWRGRLLNDADDQRGAPPAAVIAFDTWQSKYGSDPSVVGATYQINGRAFTIVGVAPAGFVGARPDAGTDFWLPLATEPLIAGATSRLEDPRTAWLDLIGRARDDADPRTVEAQLHVELQEWLASHVPDMSPAERARRGRQTLHVTPGGAGVSLMRETYRNGFRLLLFAAVCVLLVACANIASLLLARGVRNRDQIALRAALGASRARLVRQALAESLTLALFGAAAGIVVAYGGTVLILHLAFGGPNTFVPLEATPSVPMLLFALSISIATGIAFGVAPAWLTLHTDPMDALRVASRSAGGRRQRALHALVIFEAAVSVVLLSAAAMLGVSLRNLEHQDFGFELNGRYLVAINTMLAGYKQEQLVPVLQQIQDRVRRLPGVRGVSPTLYAPMSRFSWSHDIRVVGKPTAGPNDDAASHWTRVMPGFFETLGDPIVMGRPITDEDNADGRPVAVINEAFARHFFGTQNPIGERFGPASQEKAGTYEIVGVASDVRYFLNATRPIGPMYFVPEAQTTPFEEARLQSREVWSHYPYSIVIWAPGSPPELGAQVTKALADFDIPVYDIQPYADVIGQDYAPQDMMASLTWLFGIIGLVLAAVGLYGVTAYGVEQRTSEIGVRMALGAGRASVVAMVLREAFSHVGTGLALGIPVAIGAGLLMANQLFGVKPWDPLILSGAALLLMLATLVAAAMPARRAAGVDPAEALRAE